jgi:hypothetical protein
LAFVRVAVLRELPQRRPQFLHLLHQQALLRSRVARGGGGLSALSLEHFFQAAHLLRGGGFAVGGLPFFGGGRGGRGGVLLLELHDAAVQKVDHFLVRFKDTFTTDQHANA